MKSLSRFALLALAAATLSSVVASAADTSAITVLRTADGCIRYEVCQNQTGTGACTSGGSQVVIGPLGNVALSLDVNGSAAGVTANIETCREGYTACPAGAGAGVDLFPSEVTIGQIGQFVGVVGYAWVEVSANPSNNADAFVTVCKE